VHWLRGETKKHTLSSVAEMRDAISDLFKLRIANIEGLNSALARLTGGSP
jgi:hypothetical protein